MVGFSPCGVICGTVDSAVWRGAHVTAFAVPTWMDHQSICAVEPCHSCNSRAGRANLAGDNLPSQVNPSIETSNPIFPQVPLIFPMSFPFATPLYGDGAGDDIAFFGACSRKCQVSSTLLKPPPLGPSLTLRPRIAASMSTSTMPMTQKCCSPSRKPCEVRRATDLLYSCPCRAEP